MFFKYSNRALTFFLLITLWFSMGCDDDDIIKEDLPPFEMVSNTEISGNFTTDVWGYQTSGKEYAIVGDISHGLANFSIVDVTNPNNPIEVSSTSYTAFDMKVWQNFLYVVDGARDKTAEDEGAIYDISDPSNPVAVGSFPSCHNIFIDDQGFLYLTGRNDFIDSQEITFGISIYNLNNSPTLPELVWTSDLDPSHDIAVIGDRMYDFHKESGTFIYDVSDRNQPALLGTIDPPINIFHHSGWPTPDGQHLFITDEFADTEAVEAVMEGPDIPIYNISDPANPVLVGEIHDDSSRVHNLYIIDTLAYVSYYAAGLKVFDVSDPANPEALYTFDTNEEIDKRTRDGFHGAFGVYPFSPSGTVYVSNVSNDLFLFRRN